jgi:carbonic anhydrase/acetyltransferase-like protein (isoleucine patch superfamily)
MPKYELVKDDTIQTTDGRTLYRIRALRTFGTVRAGDFGGFVEGEKNLLHHGLCWVADDAKVFERAKISTSAYVGGTAQVFGYARISKKAKVYGNASVSGHAEIMDDATVFDNAKVSGSVQVWHGKIHGDALVDGNAHVLGGNIYGTAHISGDARVLCASVCRSHFDTGDIEIDFQEMPEPPQASPMQSAKHESGPGGGPR